MKTPHRTEGARPVNRPLVLMFVVLSMIPALAPGAEAEPPASESHGHSHGNPPGLEEEERRLAEVAAATPIADADAPRPARDPCSPKMLLLLPRAGRCTHGADPQRVGVDITKSVAPLDPSVATAEAASFQCDGDGVSGRRTQVLYVRSSDVGDRFAEFGPSFKQWVAEADRIYRVSAAETGGDRRIRFVHDAGCVPTITQVVLSPRGDNNFDNTIQELADRGYRRFDRKYMIFMDANRYCGIGTVSGDDRPGSGNVNNDGPSYGRTDAGCWGGRVAAHEHMHNLGGVQLSAPNSSGGWHCVDEYEVMCYRDKPRLPQMQIVCANEALNDTRFDCNHDDYFNANPLPDSYLATHWNVYNSVFLTGQATPPSFWVEDAALSEGNSGTRDLTVDILRSGPADEAASVQYATADGTATAPSDYSAKPLTTVIFEPGQVRRTVTVEINGDSAVEPDETFRVQLSTPSGAIIADGTATGTILNDDASSLFSVNDVSVIERNFDTRNAVFTVTRTGPAAGPASLRYATADGTAKSPGDYAAKSLTTLNFSAGQATKTVAVSVKGDRTAEPDESFFLRLSNPTGAAIADDSGTGTILNDD